MVEIGGEPHKRVGKAERRDRGGDGRDLCPRQSFAHAPLSGIDPVSLLYRIYDRGIGPGIRRELVVPVDDVSDQLAIQRRRTLCSGSLGPCFLRLQVGEFAVGPHTNVMIDASKCDGSPRGRSTRLRSFSDVRSESGLAAAIHAHPEAARFLGLSGRALEKHRTYGTGPAYRKLGGRVVYALEDLKAWADRGAKTSTSDPGTGTVLGRGSQPSRRKEERHE